MYSLGNFAFYVRSDAPGSWFGIAFPHDPSQLGLNSEMLAYEKCGLGPWTKSNLGLTALLASRKLIGLASGGRRRR